MEKNLKIVAILLVVATVVFAAGCAGKTTNSGNETSENETSGNETPDVSNQTTPAVTIPSPIETSNVTEKANETVAEGNNTEKTENITKPVIRKATYVAPHEPSSEANQITYTVYNNSENNTPVVSNQGTLKIISNETNTSQGNTTTVDDPLRKEKIAQNHTSSYKTISL
ncbi:hypothetical protein [Methanosarcina sp. UBA5]|uniref:hypothetical protein n=1 Tax=Methanosarcina sp. UBA5 TaxID=1915593 RepID=UPI0025D95A62|nr:hypothetical protein [Methanosarcina sp. UBA5]